MQNKSDLKYSTYSQGRSQDYFEGGSDLKWPECLKGKAWVLPLDHV